MSTGAGEYHVRLYVEGKYYIRSHDDFRFELALLEALADAGCPVARPMRRDDGALLSTVELDSAERRLAVFELAPGDVADEPTVEVATALGDALARIHNTADSVSMSGGRYDLDERYLIRQPIEQLGRAAPAAAELSALAELGDELAGVLSSLPRQKPAYGLIHADMHLGNVHFTSDGRPTIFDFDHCARGWRAYDLAPLRMQFDDVGWRAALRAYETHRDLPEGIDRIDELTKVRTLWDIGDMLAMETAWGSADVSQKIPEVLPRLAARLGVPSTQ